MEYRMALTNSDDCKHLVLVKMLGFCARVSGLLKYFKEELF